MTSRRLTPRGKERRRQLMDFAARRFAEKGFHPTSVAEIVEGLGVGKGVFYWYFESKDDLLVAILVESQTDLRRAQQAAIGAEPDPVRRLELGIDASMQWFADHPHLVRLTHFATTERRFSQPLRQNQQIALSDAMKHLRDAMATGAIRDEDPEMLAQAVVGLSSHLARERIHRKGDDPASVARMVKDFMLYGLGATPPSATPPSATPPSAGADR